VILWQDGPRAPLRHLFANSPEQGPELLAQPPLIETVDALAAKLP
jgi:hypothetical protein